MAVDPKKSDPHVYSLISQELRLLSMRLEYFSHRQRFADRQILGMLEERLEAALRDVASDYEHRT